MLRCTGFHIPDGGGAKRRILPEWTPWSAQSMRFYACVSRAPEVSLHNFLTCPVRAQPDQVWEGRIVWEERFRCAT